LSINKPVLSADSMVLSLGKGALSTDKTVEIPLNPPD
jgi:hypothetical protein